MKRFRKAVPLVVASSAGILVVAAALGQRGAAENASSPASPPAAADLPTSGSREPPPVATAGVSAAQVGEQLLIPVHERTAAPPLSVQTASFGDGSVFAAPVDGVPATIVFFMAAWCFTCYPEAKALAAIQERYGTEGVTVLALDVDPNEGEPELAAFRERTGRGAHLWAFDRGFELARALEVNRLDATVVIDREGRIAYRDASPTGYDDLSAVVEALLAEGPA